MLGNIVATSGGPLVTPPAPGLTRGRVGITKDMAAVMFRFSKVVGFNYMFFRGRQQEDMCVYVCVLRWLGVECI